MFYPSDNIRKLTKHGVDMKNQRKVGALLSYAVIIVSTLVNLLYMPFMLRKIGQSEFGLYSLISSVIGYLTVFDLGFGNAIVVFTAKYRQSKDIDSERKLHGMFSIIYWVIGIIAGIFGLLLYFNTNRLFGETMTGIEIQKAKIMLLILTFNLVISFGFSIYSSIITAYEQFVFQKILAIIRSLLNPILMIPLLLLGCKSITMVIVITVLNIGCLILNFLYCKNKLHINVKFGGFDKALFVSILGFSIYIFIGTVVDKINWSVDQFILGAVAGTAAVSLYAVANQINLMFINLSTAISGVLLPKVSQMVAGNASDDDLTNEFIKVGRLQYIVIFLMVSAFILFGKEFVLLWAGTQYLTSYYIAIILIVPVAFPLIQNLGLSIIQAKGLNRDRAIIVLSTSIVNVIISIPLAKVYGGIGCAIGTAFALIIANIFIMNIYYYIKVKINVIKFWKQIIKMTLPYIFIIIPFIIFMDISKLTGIMNLLVYGSIYTVLYCIVSYRFSMNLYEREIVYGIIKKIFRK